MDRISKNEQGSSNKLRFTLSLHKILVNSCNFNSTLSRRRLHQAGKRNAGSAGKQTSAYVSLFLCSHLFGGKVSIFNILTLCQHRYFIYKLNFW